MNWKGNKLRVVVWITLAMLVEAGLVLWPLGVVLTYLGLLSMSVITFVGVGLSYSLAFGLFISLTRGLFLGLAIGLFIGLFGSLFSGLAFGLALSLFIGLVRTFFVGLDVGLSLGVFTGVPFGILLYYGFRELGKGGINSVKQFFTPWRLERLYFGRSIGLFVMLYMVFVLLFALWFYASYLNAAKELPTPAINSYFKTQDISPTSNFWTFVYFSFITISSLGYGDICPTHWFSQFLVILETMVGIGLIAGFLAVIITVGGRGNKRIPERDLDDY